MTGTSNLNINASSTHGFAPAVTEHVLNTDRHTTFYLASGPEDGPAIIFIHGWPECSRSWRHQLAFFAALGFRAIAPDMRGYGQSGVYDDHDSYRQEHIVLDMIELLDSLGAERAIWIGHDWGSPVAWNVATHHPDRCFGVGNLCVPLATVERTIEEKVKLVDRDIYPEDRFPVGQWDYQCFYKENFGKATSEMDANPSNFIKLVFRKGSPDEYGQPAVTAFMRENNGWFPGMSGAPASLLDADILNEDDLAYYAGNLARNGFFGPNSWYMNDEANEDYFQKAVNGGKIDMPVLFVGAKYDHVCKTVDSRLGDPMRERCTNLTERLVLSGHWMAQEKPQELNRHLVGWMASSGLLAKAFPEDDRL